MRIRLTTSLFVLAFLLGAGLSDACAGVLYLDGLSPNDYSRQAALNLGHSVTTVTTNSAFVSALASSSWDLVLVEAPFFTTNVPAESALANYINGGGRSILSQYFGSGIMPAFDVTTAYASFESPMTVNVWDTSHPIFNSANSISGLNVAGDFAGTYNGQYLKPLSGGVSLAGFTTGVTIDRAAIVLGNDGRTIYHGFAPDDMVGAQAIDLLENEIGFLLPDAAEVPEPASLALFSLGALGLVFGRRRSQRRAG